MGAESSSRSRVGGVEACASAKGRLVARGAAGADGDGSVVVRMSAGAWEERSASGLRPSRKGSFVTAQIDGWQVIYPRGVQLLHPQHGEISVWTDRMHPG